MLTPFVAKMAQAIKQKLSEREVAHGDGGGG